MSKYKFHLLAICCVGFEAYPISQTPFLPDDVTEGVVAYSGHERYQTFEVKLMEFCTFKSMCFKSSQCYSVYICDDFIASLNV